MMKTLMIILACLFVSACTNSPRSGTEVIARVNDIDIQLKDYINLYETIKPRDVELTGRERQEMRNLILQTLVRRAVILSNAEKLGVRVTEEELREGIDRVKQGYPDQIFQESLFEGMVDEKEWQEQVRQSLLIEKMVRDSRQEIQAPTLEESMQYYQDHPHFFRRAAEVTSLHIAVADEELAKKIHEDLQKNEKSFRKLAKEHSIGPEAQKDSKITVEKGTMPEEIDEVLFAHPLRKVTPVVKSPYGYHLFYILERSNAVNLDFKQVRNEIFERLYEEKKKRWMDSFEEELVRSAEIEYNRELIRQL